MGFIEYLKKGFEDWSFSVWFNKNKLFFIKNKDTIKSFIMAIFGYIASTYPDNVLIKIAFGIGGAYVTNLIISAIDYFFTENPE
jgi:hypothetical protein